MFAVNVCNGQKIYTDVSLAFSIEEPVNWLTAAKGETMKNTKDNIKLSEENLKKILDSNKGTIQIVAFFKYPIEEHPGVIPTIKVNLQKNHFKTFEGFLKRVETRYNGVEKVFPDFKYITAPTASEVNGHKCVKSSITYTFKAHDGEGKVIVSQYDILIKDKAIIISLMDSGDENNNAIFEKIVKSIILE